MLSDFLDLFFKAEVQQGGITINAQFYPITNDIPRFTGNRSYSTGNFSALRDRHARLQLDSANGTTDRLDTILFRTGWPAEFFHGKTVLECGCGAGPDTEVLLSLGAKVVAADIAGVDVAKDNLGDRKNLCLIQANIVDLPLNQRSFDIVWCHRVLQHTPDPHKTLDHILQFVKPGGSVFIHSYSRDFRQMFRWKYALRPITKRMDAERLYALIERFSPVLFRFTRATGRHRLGRHFNWIFVPFLNHAHKPKFSAWSEESLIELGIHETFDALSPKYDKPVGERDMRRLGDKHLSRPFEVVTSSAITLLRTTGTDVSSTC